MHITNFQKLRNGYTKGKNLSAATYSDRFFTQEELQLKQWKHKQIPPQIRLATLTQLTHDSPKNLCNIWVKPETEIASKEDEECVILVDFQNDQFSILNNDKREKIFHKTLVSFSIENVKPLQNQSEKPRKKETKTLSAQSALLRRLKKGFLEVMVFLTSYLLKKMFMNKQLRFHWLIIHPALEKKLNMNMKIYEGKPLLKLIFL